MWNLLGLVLLALVTLVKTNEPEYLEVSLEQGVLRGFISDDALSYSFQGIPYATAPQRYKAPLASPPSWSGILDARKSNVACNQVDATGTHLGTEDCLVVNVYIPVGAQKDSSLAVFVINHGGAFTRGSGSLETYHLHRIMMQDTIIVSYNYRLGALGFLCLGTEEVPGNAGLKDQVAALRWIKNNIASFGGNPSDVTVYGPSAGSASLELLVLSEATNGLFNRAILESGSAVGSWAVGYDPISVAKYAADFMGFPNIDDLNVLTEIFINATPEELSFASAHLAETLTDTTIGFSPCIESRKDNFTVLADSPKIIITSENYNPVPLMVVYGDMEGMYRLSQWEAGWNTIFLERFADFLPPDLSFGNDLEKVQVAETIKQFYVDNTENDIQAYVDFTTDVMFAYSIISSSLLHAKNSVPVYLMEFSFYDDSSVLPGAPHAELIKYIFNTRVSGPPNEQVGDRAATMVRNFMKHKYVLTYVCIVMLASKL